MMKKEKIIETAVKRLQKCIDIEKENRLQAREDAKFIAGEQWDPALKKYRLTSNPPRPCLTINKLVQHRNQITNSQRQSRISIKVRPVDNEADDKKAEIIQGLIRKIESQSMASVARDTAFECAVDCGYGFYRIVTDYAGPDTFEQEIYIRPIKNPFCVYVDPDAVAPDFSDMDFVFIIDKMKYDEFKRKYPKAKTSGADGRIDGIDAGQDDVVVFEYFVKEYMPEKTIVLLENGETIEESELIDNKVVKIGDNGETIEIEAQRNSNGDIVKRTVSDYKIRWYKMTAGEILEERDWPGRYIPVVCVYGVEKIVDGKIIRHGIVRNSKDAQRMYNFWVSCEMERVSLSPKAPFIGTVEQFRGLEQYWAAANTETYAYLPYNAVGNAPPPQRIFPPGIDAAMIAAKQGANDDIKATTGIYDPSLGMRSNETSGRAILARQTQSDIANFHFIDNLIRAVTYEGKVLVDLIPHIYDTQRTIRIIGEDDRDMLVTINQMTPDGGKTLYDMTVGRYDVTVHTGPSFASRRAEAAEAMIEFTRVNPAASQVIMDLIAKNMDWPGADEIEKRLKRLVPPQALGEDDPIKLAALLNSMRNENAALKQKLQELTAELTVANTGVAAEVNKARIKAAADLQKEKVRLGAKIIGEKIKKSGPLPDQQGVTPEAVYGTRPYAGI